ncbi:arginine kinase-like [Bradysia coprophila]|uniref:arginine kinase-like n=1 Tax=Bradysia coprophila TaxID=38358 RepID=UPI00187D8758|nr:arginine kinase-like [Bradysia coprophila]
MTVNYDREEFRKYLQESGAVEALSRTFLKLYELKENRPKSSIKFIQDRITDSVPSVTEYAKLKDDLNAMGVILRELKTKGKLDPAHLTVFDKIGTNFDTLDFLGDKGHPRLSARHSQIAEGHQWKKDSKKIASTREDQSDDIKMSNKIKAFLSNPSHKSLLRAHLNDTIYNNYKKVTVGSSGHTTSFIDCICSGLDFPESAIGVYATDAEAYNKFEDLFKPIIKAYHGYDTASERHPGLDWGNPTTLDNIDTTSTYICWTRIRCVRNVDKQPLVPKMNENELTTLCSNIQQVFEKNLTADEIKGHWYGLETVDPAKKKELIDKNYILEFGDKFLESVGATEHWPKGRAVYINDNETFFVWINEEDHLRFISMESGSKISDIYGRLVRALEAVANGLTFQRDANDTLGFVSLCPTNLGNTIRASVMVKLPKLIKQMGAKNSELDKLINTHNFEIRPTKSDKETIEISNKRKLGITEFDSIKKFWAGIKEIIEKEKTS